MKKTVLLSVFITMILYGGRLYGEDVTAKSDNTVQSGLQFPQPEQPPGFGGGMPAMPGGPPAPFSYGFQLQGKQSVTGQDTDFETYRQTVDMMVPVTHNGPDSLMFSAGMIADKINTSAILPDSLKPFPDTLWNIRLGLNYMQRLEKGWSFMGGVNASSASDRPFGAIRDINAGGMMLLSIPERKHDALNLGFMYMPLSDMRIPVPTIAYLWRPNPDFHMNIGMPFQVMYKPDNDLTFDCSYMLLRNIQARLTYRLNKRCDVYTAYAWSNQAWTMHEREDDDERLNSYNQSISLGIRPDVFRYLVLDASAGYIFDRFFFTGKDYSDRNHDRINIDSGPYLSIKIGLKW
jgi:hypothetical protein